MTVALPNCQSGAAVGIVRTSESFATEGRFEQGRRQRRRLTVGQETSSLQATRWTRNRSGSWLLKRAILDRARSCLSHPLAIESRLAGRAPPVFLTPSLRTPSPGRLGRRKARSDGEKFRNPCGQATSRIPSSISIMRCALLSQTTLNDTGLVISRYLNA